jgi:Tfp pilus assembly protein PilV
MKNREKKSGQSLIEVMVALFVLTVGMLGILDLLSQSLHISKTVGDETTATYLAAEGIELSENIIEHDVYQQNACLGVTGWAQGSPDATFQVNHVYQLDYTTCTNLMDQATLCSSQLQPTPAGSLQPLYFDSSTGLYNNSENGVQTPFTREIKILPSDNSNNNELTVQSIVTWDVGLTQQKVTLEDHFYNWQPPSTCT